MHGLFQNDFLPHIICLFIHYSFNLFVPNAIFLYSLKTSENRKVKL